MLHMSLSPVSIQTQSLALRVNENRKKRKRLSWQAANHGCHCFDRAFLLAGACITQALAFLTVFVYATHVTQAIAFEWKPGLLQCLLKLSTIYNLRLLRR